MLTKTNTKQLKWSFLTFFNKRTFLTCGFFGDLTGASIDNNSLDLCIHACVGLVFYSYRFTKNGRMVHLKLNPATRIYTLPMNAD